MKRLTGIILALMMACSVVHAATPDLTGVVEKTAQAVWIKNPGFGEVGGDWVVFGLARSGRMDESYAKLYADSVGRTLTKSGGVLSQNKYTDYSRVILTLTAIGRDASDFFGYDLPTYLADYDKVTRQGINGAVYALLALDAGDYLPESDLRERYLEFVLSREKGNGGFSLDDEAKEPDADLTAMALNALYPYREREDVAPVTERALAVLAQLEGKDGIYSDAFGVPNCESCAQVVVALCTYGVEPTKSQLNGLLRFYTGDGFSHLIDEDADQMATEQALLALGAYERLTAGKCGVYGIDDPLQAEEAKSTENEEEEVPMVLPFADLDGHWAHDTVASLWREGKVNGVSDTAFEPDRTISRAELCTLLVNNFDVVTHNAEVAFSDVSAQDWFYKPVFTMTAAGVVRGNGDGSFLPHNPVTRTEAAVMLNRIAPIYVKLSADAVRNYLAQFDDYTTVPDWGRDALAQCVAGGIYGSDALTIRPNDALTRAEACALIVRMKEGM